MNEPQIKIVVMDRGWIKIGYLSIHPTLAFHWRMTNGRVIRYWGTEEGLAELANGPIEGKTKLDRKHNSSIPFRAVLDIIDVEESKWKKHLS